MPLPVVRVSILRCQPEAFAKFQRMMTDAEPMLGPGIRAMKGLVSYWAGADAATSSLTNVSVWQTLEDANQMEHFTPMKELGRRFTAEGAVFERPIMNYATVWQLQPQGADGSAPR
jgi:hypothetical protein